MQDHEVLNGPMGLWIELNSDEVYPRDPGMGTPAMVYCCGSPHMQGQLYSATFNCAVNEGELNCGCYQLSTEQCTWPRDQEPHVQDWLEVMYVRTNQGMQL